MARGGSLLRKLHKEVLRNLTGTGSGGEGVRGGKNFYQTEEMNLSRSTEKMGICACVFYVGGVGEWFFVPDNHSSGLLYNLTIDDPEEK